MTSSTNPPFERCLDAMLLVYSLLPGHPASLACEQFLLSHSGWFTSPLVLTEAKHILTSVYSVNAGVATAKLVQVVGGPMILCDLDSAVTTSALQLADAHGLDLTDAVLLHLTVTRGAHSLATEDQRLAKACLSFGVTPVTPLNASLRQQVAAWETTHLAPKGLPRFLRRVHQWLSQSHPQAAQDFLTHTGGATHLP
jgi:predicted nucleic acid-binding protein